MLRAIFALNREPRLKLEFADDDTRASVDRIRWQRGGLRLRLGAAFAVCVELCPEQDSRGRSNG